MRFSSRVARRRRGTPLWAYLTALVVLPLLGVVALTGAIVRIAVDEAGSAARSEAAIGALARLHAARSAVIREIVPTLTLVIIEDPGSAALVGPDKELLLDLREAARGLLLDSRALTDQVLDEFEAGSLASPAVAAATRRLAWVRAAADGNDADAIALYQDFTSLAEDLTGAQRRAARAAAAEQAPVATMAATRDVQLLAEVATLASRLVPEFIGAQLLGGSNAEHADWEDSWSSYVHATEDLAELSQPLSRTGGRRSPPHRRR